VDEALRKLDPANPGRALHAALHDGRFQKQYGDVLQSVGSAQATKETRAIVEHYHRAVEDKDHSTQETFLALFASTHTVKETAIAFGVGRWRIKRAKLRARLGNPRTPNPKPSTLNPRPYLHKSINSLLGNENYYTICS
jgi:hypothetical protein